jgi:hypothetical protein
MTWKAAFVSLGTLPGSNSSTCSVFGKATDENLVGMDSRKMKEKGEARCLRDYIRNVVTMFEISTSARHLIKNIYKTFVSNCGVPLPTHAASSAGIF